MPEASVANSLLNYGVLGLGVLVLGWVVRFLYTEMKEERAKAHAERLAAFTALEGNTKALQGNTEVLAEIKRLLESAHLPTRKR